MRIILALLLATSYAAPLSDDPISIGSRKQLFIDRKFIQSDTGVTLRMNPPLKAGVALTADHPWEQGWLTGSGYVSEDGGRYRMWYAIRGQRYRIGYAESADGLTWTRLDNERGLSASGSGWDSDMVEYPWLFGHNGREYMLYNGDDYGRSGVGLAVWESAD